MKKNDVMKSIRFNKRKDKDLLEFFEKKGLKYGIKFLFEFYENNKDVASKIIDYIENEIDLSNSNPPQKLSKTNISKKQDSKSGFNIEDDGFDITKF